MIRSRYIMTRILPEFLFKPGKMTCKYMLIFIILFFIQNSIGYAHPYTLSLKNEVTYFSLGGTFYLTGSIFDNKKSLPTITDLERLNTKDIPSFDRHYAGFWNTDADKLSDVFLTSSLLLPLTLFFSRKNDSKTFAFMYAEVLLITTGGVNLAKGTVSRYRPFAFGDKSPLKYRLERDAKRSFFSGHAAQITADFLFTAKVYSDSYPDSPYCPYIWGGAILGSLYGSWLRVESGWHFPSDVIAGFIWGGLVGYSIPFFHKNNIKGFSILPLSTNNTIGTMIIKNF